MIYSERKENDSRYRALASRKAKGMLLKRDRNATRVLRKLFAVVALATLAILLPESVTASSVLEADYGVDSTRLPSATDTLGAESFRGQYRAIQPQHDDDASSVHTGVPFFDEAVRLLKENCVNEVSDDLLFNVSLQLLTMTLLPQCVENVPNMALCTDTLENCFMGSVRAIAKRCNIKTERVLSAALNNVLRNLDHNSGLMDEAALKEIKISTSGKFGGVGLVVADRGGKYTVVSSFEGSPAHRAGIKSGDTVLEIDGRPVNGLPLLEVLRMVRGPVGSTMSVTLTEANSDKPHHVKLRRKEIVVPPVRYAMAADDVAYLRIVNFQDSTFTEVEKGMSRLLNQSRGTLAGLILDLRDNPGGLFDQAIKVANLLVSSGVITSIRGRNKLYNREFKADHRRILPSIPIVVLVNHGTASASEVLAGALQRKPNVVLMGERTFGKASVQAVFPLDKNHALRVTTAHYFTAEGADLEGTGLQPDILVEESRPALAEGKINPLRGTRPETDDGIKMALEYVLSQDSRQGRPFASWF